MSIAPCSAPSELAQVNGPVHLVVHLPVIAGGIDPLVSAACDQTVPGEIVAATFGENHTLRFSLYGFGQTTLESDPIAYDPAKANDLACLAGAFQASRADPRLADGSDRLVLPELNEAGGRFSTPVPLHSRRPIRGGDRLESAFVLRSVGEVLLGRILSAKIEPIEQSASPAAPAN